MRRLDPIPRRDVGAACGFNREPDSVIPQPQTVPDLQAEGFLRGLGMKPELIEQTSAEIGVVLGALPSGIKATLSRQISQDAW